MTQGSLVVSSARVPTDAMTYGEGRSRDRMPTGFVSEQRQAREQPRLVTGELMESRSIGLPSIGQLTPVQAYLMHASPYKGAPHRINLIA